MGYFADIIKDSRLYPARGRSPVAPLPDMDGQAWPAAAQEAAPGSPIRRLFGQKTQAGPIESQTVPAEIVSVRRPKAGRMQRVKTSQDIRFPAGAGDEHPGPGGPIEAPSAPAAMPVIQRQAVTDPEPRSSTVSGTRQAERPSRRQLAAGLPASRRLSVSPRPPDISIDPSVQELSPRLARPAGKLQAEMNRQLAQPIESENSVIKTQAPPAVEPSAVPANQANRSTAADASAPARLKGAATKPSSAVASIGSVRAVENITSASAGRIDQPRVQIGQVNVIVEESRVPPKAPPGDLRRDDSASRTFLRSL